MKNTNKRKYFIQDKGGFTLVELMMALAIMGIMATIVVPVTLAWLPNYRLKSAARDMHSAFMNARMLAVRENIPVQVILNNTVNPGFYSIDLNGNGIVDQPGEYRVNMGQYGSGVDFGFPAVPAGFVNWNGTPVGASVTFGGGPPPFCTYNSNGTTGNGTVYLVNNEFRIVYAITTVTSGSVKTRKYNGIQPFNQNNW